jgi:hypothetical protein
MKCAPYILLLPSSWQNSLAYCENTTAQGGGGVERRGVGFLRTKKKVAAVNEGGEAEGFVCKWLLQK